MPKSSIATRTPSALNSAESSRGVVGVAHGDALGDLECEVLRVEPGRGERLVDVDDEGVVVELLARDVDREVERETVLAPDRGLRARGAQHPPADIDDHPGLLEQRDEEVGMDDAANSGAASG